MKAANKGGTAEPFRPFQDETVFLFVFMQERKCNLCIQNKLC